MIMKKYLSAILRFLIDNKGYWLAPFFIVFTIFSVIVIAEGAGAPSRSTPAFGYRMF
jgi:Family of unknown function (DUF5989)